jgi:hypothetical protein
MLARLHERLDGGSLRAAYEITQLRYGLYHAAILICPTTLIAIVLPGIIDAELESRINLYPD